MKNARWQVRLVRVPPRVRWGWIGGGSLAAGGVLGVFTLRPWWASITAGVDQWWPVVGVVILLGLGVMAMHQRTMAAAGDTRQARTTNPATEHTTADAATQAVDRRSTLSGWVVLAAALGVFGAAGLVLAALWDWSAAPGLNAKDAASTRLDTVKIAASVAVGGGGLFALYLAARRQRTQELELAQRSAEFVHSEHDATERRVTELYTKAVEQLGSDKAVVRQGGLYALERVAQDNLAHRQTVINVICAYLRAPYTPPPASPAARRTGLFAGSLRSTPATRAPSNAAALRRATLNIPTSTGRHEDLRQEREVRLTAQRIIAAHLRPDLDENTGQPANPRYWREGYDLDLTGAVLIDLDMTGCHLRTVSFGDATFSGDASFDNAVFSGTTSFDNAGFSGTTRFDGATFSGTASFENTGFSGTASFENTGFSGTASFDNAGFSGTAWFHDATFSGTISFDNATFSGTTSFDDATFSDATRFHDATFSGTASFDDATFSDATRFDDARFSGTTWFDGARFSGTTRFDNASFSGTTRFDNASFSETTRFENASFSETTRFDNATFSGDASFDMADFSDDASFSNATFSGDASFDEADFSGNALFDEADFSGIAWFDDATFSGDASFDYATFSGAALFDNATFSGTTRFRGATFSGDTSFGNAVFVVVARAHDVWVRVRVDRGTEERSWPAGWTADMAAAAPRDGQEGSWAKLVPVPIVLAPLPAEWIDSQKAGAQTSN